MGHDLDAAMSDQLGSVTVDTCGNMIELEARSHGESTGLSVLISPEQFAALVVRAEQLEPMLQYRRREARESHSHEARASRR
jgi:hypothetical protein